MGNSWPPWPHLGPPWPPWPPWHPHCCDATCRPRRGHNLLLSCCSLVSQVGEQWQGQWRQRAVNWNNLYTTDIQLDLVPLCWGVSPLINPNQIKLIGRWFNQLRNAPEHAPHSIHHPWLPFEAKAWQEHATILRHPHNWIGWLVVRYCKYSTPKYDGCWVRC